MTIEEILAGESKNVEFKENLPEKSIKYMKSVVAFANGTGGKIIFGIADKTREVVGFDKEDVFKKMDAIANAVSDSCESAIIPDITLQTVEGKTVIVVEVSEGRQRPYYIKALGRDGGVYVRVAGTTRLADEYMVKELLFEGSNRYYDQALCTGLNITDEDIDDLCKAMKEQAVKNAHNEEQKAAIKDVGRQQLRSWGGLIERQVDGTVDLNDLNNAIKVPNTIDKMPDSIEKMPDTAKEMPDSSDGVPDKTEKMPDSEQEQQIYKYVSENGPITAAETAELLEVKPRRARAVLLNMVRESYLKKEGAARSTIYVKNTKRR
ncbi:ATP-binding protein [Roseburia hominis]|uniref:AlbA family DNA-binding domain-containing protein n=1 Tax=Roseburia hominis TaxID=301301 RepID=UPI00307CC91A